MQRPRVRTPVEPFFSIISKQKLLHLTQCPFDPLTVNEICNRLNDNFIDDVNDQFGTDSDECTFCDVKTVVIDQNVQLYFNLIVELYHKCVKQSPKEDINKLTIDEFAFIASSTQFKSDYQRKDLAVIRSSWTRRCVKKHFTRDKLLDEYKIKLNERGKMIDSGIETVDLTSGIRGGLFMIFHELKVQE